VSRGADDHAGLRFHLAPARQGDQVGRPPPWSAARRGGPHSTNAKGALMPKEKLVGRLTVVLVDAVPVTQAQFDFGCDYLLRVYDESLRCLKKCVDRVSCGEETRQVKPKRLRKVDPFVKRYFGSELRDMSMGERATIRRVLQKTLDGLEANPKLVINPGKDDAAGFVPKTLLPDPENLPSNPHEKAKVLREKQITATLQPPKWNYNKDKFQKEYVISNEEINISPDWIAFDQSQEVRFEHACVTVIHEATHKYAKTWDYCYFKHGGLTGVDSPEPGRFDATDPENAFAHHGDMKDTVRFFVGNADSYGYFAFHAAQKKEAAW
jgi:hypothetical protein